MLARMRAFAFSLVLLLAAGGVARAQAIPAGAIVAFNEGKRLLKDHQTDNAIARLQQAVELAPQYGEAWTELGNAYVEKQRYAEAAPAFKKALDAKPDQSVARYNLAFSLRKLGRNDDAAEQYRMYLQSNPNDADAHYGLAETLRAAGDKVAAAEAYEAYARAETNPAQEKWVAKARQTAAALREEAKAVAPREKAARKEPKAETKDSLHLSFTEKPVEKSATPERAAVPPVKVSSPRPDSFRAGLTRLQNGDYTAALPQLEAADREMPNDALILAALGSAHLGLEHGEEAETMYQRAIGLASDDALPGLYLGLGEARRLLGKNDLAVDAYRHVMDHARASSSIKRFSEERIAALR